MKDQEELKTRKSTKEKEEHSHLLPLHGGSLLLLGHGEARPKAARSSKQIQRATHNTLSRCPQQTSTC